MNGTVESLAAKIGALQLRISQIAEIEDFVDFLRFRAQDRQLTRAVADISGPAFAAVWSNPEDEVYDAL